MNIDVASITPVPTEEEAAAIAAAITMMWPTPIEQSRNEREKSNVSWRFSGRWWASHHVSRRTRPGA